MSVRGWLYAIARAIGDWNAIRRGRVKQRVWRRLVGRWLSRFLR